MAEWAVRIIIAVVFITAVLAKMIDPLTIIDTINYLLGSRLSLGFLLLMLSLLVAFECTIGAAVLLCPWSRAPVLAVAVASILFSAFLLKLATAEQPPSCGCLGGLLKTDDARLEAMAGLVRNGGLLICSAWLMPQARKRSKTNGPDRERSVQ